MNEYQASQGLEVAGVGVIQSNPDQSKHLETATMKARLVAAALLGLRSSGMLKNTRINACSRKLRHLCNPYAQVHGVWLDLVNLRSETYAEDSRIPGMRFGTAQEVGLRAHNMQPLPARCG